MLVCASGLTTITVKPSVSGADVVTVPTVQRPVVRSYVPWLGAADTNVTPRGS